MVPFLLTAREHHGVTSPEALRRRHAQAIAKLTRAGMRYRVHQDPQPVHAFVSAGSWVVVCPACSSGCAVEPAWAIACCFGCGAVYESVVLPPDRDEIEAALLERPSVTTRHWTPLEKAADLRTENARLGGRRP